MAYSSSSLSWDLQSLGVFNGDMSLVMDHEAASLLSPDLYQYSDIHDFSTGYLEDALLESSDRSKRRRLLLFSEDHEANICPKDFTMQSYWNSTCNWGLQSENFSCMSQTTSINGVSSDELMSSVSGMSNEEANIIPEIKTPEETITSSTLEALDSSSSSHKVDSIIKTKSHFDRHSQRDDTVNTLPSIFSASGLNYEGGGDSDNKRKKKSSRLIKRVVYPFALVKPGGTEDDVTLNDINERILMPPSRPVKHPVGDFACRPCVSAHGPGLSGKAVVALTRIHTQGRGTITIIKTKG